MWLAPYIFKIYSIIDRCDINFNISEHPVVCALEAFENIPDPIMFDWATTGISSAVKHELH